MHWDASEVEILVYTFREGLFAAVGHDLCLRVTRLSLDVGPEDAIVCECDAASLRVTGVSADDARKIEKNAADDVLAARRFAAIAFRSTRVVRDGEHARVEGTLSLHGTTRPLAFDATAGGDGWHAEVRLDQRDFGIKPYSAMLGALRVRPDILIKIRVPRT